MAKDNTTRFSNRVDDYVKYRPGYPADIITYLRSEHDLSTNKLLADIGSGTGISTELFLNAGYRVIAVEPNAEMRRKAEELLGHIAGFISQNGTAENTGLPAQGVDGIIAGQAFHWFDRNKTREEFKRILQPGGMVALIWNERKTTSAFEVEYDALIIKHARDYVQVDHRNIDAEKIAAFFYPQPMQLKVFANQQVFNFEGLKGRLLSSSYMPATGDVGYEAMLQDLQTLYSKYQNKDTITIHYDTRVYTGTL